jgi:predicted Zn-dependent protease
MEKQSSALARIEILKRYLTEDPSDTFLRYALALEYIGINDQKQANVLLENLLNEVPDYLAGYYMAGKTSEALSDLEKAKEWYSRGILVAEHQKNQHTLSELRSALEVLED